MHCIVLNNLKIYYVAVILLFTLFYLKKNCLYLKILNKFLTQRMTKMIFSK